MRRLTGLPDAVAHHVRPGSTVCFAGLSHLIPFAAAHEIIRQGIRGLTVVRTAPDLLAEQLVVEGLVSRLVFSWAGNPGRGLLHQLRHDIEQGRLDIDEYTHHALIGRLAAGAMGLPFYPVAGLLGSDAEAIGAHTGSVTDPFTGRSWPVVAPLRPDVTFVHVQRADEQGNAQIWGLVGEVKEAAFAAETVIVTCEQLVDTNDLARDPNRVVIPARKVTAVAHVPWGAHPSYVQGFYDRDDALYEWWRRQGRDRARLERWISEHVRAARGHQGYVDAIGADRLEALRPGGSRLAPAVDYGTY
jgi:glutaconate CoA-transferase, subunit A